MAVTNDDLVNLYKSTNDERNKNIIFNKLYNNLEKGAMKICHYYSNCLLQHYREDFFEEAVQESKICLLKCIYSFLPQKPNKFITFYYKCLKNHIYNIFRTKFKNIITEVTDELVLDWVGSSFEENPSDKIVDNKILYDIFNDNIKQIDFSRPRHKEIFLDYIGFNDSKNTDETFSTLGRKYGISRVAVKKICDKYFNILVNILKEGGNLQKLKIFL